MVDVRDAEWFREWVAGWLAPGESVSLAVVGMMCSGKITLVGTVLNMMHRDTDVVFRYGGPRGVDTVARALSQPRDAECTVLVFEDVCHGSLVPLTAEEEAGECLRQYGAGKARQVLVMTSQVFHPRISGRWAFGMPNTLLVTSVPSDRGDQSYLRRLLRLRYQGAHRFLCRATERRSWAARSGVCRCPLEFVLIDVSGRRDAARRDTVECVSLGNDVGGSGQGE